MTNYDATFTVEHFAKGDRVELHPGLDRWMMGDRFGTVERLGRLFVYVRMDRSGKTIKFHPSSIGHVS
jgi:hypothetical protein